MTDYAHVPPHVGDPDEWLAEQEAGRALWDDVIDGATLDAIAFPPVRYLIERVLPVGGLVGLAGAPKIGKSALALGLALPLAAGDPKALAGFTVEHHGDALYISLDDPNQARFQRRARTVAHGGQLPGGLLFKFKPITLTQLRLMLQHGPSLRLVIIDTAERMRPPRRPTDTQYTGDVEFFGAVQGIAAEHPEVTFLLLLHTRKGDDDDPIAAVSGTHGVTGGVDHVLRLSGSRHTPRRVLEIVSRDADDSAHVLRWTSEGRLVLTADDPNDPTIHMTEDDAKVYRAVVDFGVDVTARDLKDVLPDVKNLGNRLAGLMRKGFLVQSARGTYRPA